MIDTDTDILAARIELAERSGNHELLSMLRAELAKRKAASVVAPAMTVVRPPAYDDEAMATIDNSEDCLTIALCALPTRIARPLILRGVRDMGDLAEWDFPRLSLLLTRRDVLHVFATMNVLGLGNVIGSADSIDPELPPQDPYAVDYLAGRTEGDVDRFINMLADGKSQYEVSREMGGAFGAHQCAQSLADRHSLTLCHEIISPLREAAEKRRLANLKRGAESPEVTPVSPRKNAEETGNAVKNPKRGGHSWHSADVIFVEG